MRRQSVGWVVLCWLIGMAVGCGSTGRQLPPNAILAPEAGTGFIVIGASLTENIRGIYFSRADDATVWFGIGRYTAPGGFSLVEATAGRYCLRDIHTASRKIMVEEKRPDTCLEIADGQILYGGHVEVVDANAQASARLVQRSGPACAWLQKNHPRHVDSVDECRQVPLPEDE